MSTVILIKIDIDKIANGDLELILPKSKKNKND